MNGGFLQMNNKDHFYTAGTHSYIEKSAKK